MACGYDCKNFVADYLKAYRAQGYMAEAVVIDDVTEGGPAHAVVGIFYDPQTNSLVKQKHTSVSDKIFTRSYKYVRTISDEELARLIAYDRGRQLAGQCGDPSGS